VTALALPVLAALPFAASAAEGLSYNTLEGGYAATNTDVVDADGWALKGSFALNPNFHLFGDFTRQDFKDTDVHFNQWRAGVGYNHEITSNTDLLTRVAYEKFDWGNGFTSDGYSVEAGVRSALTSRLEGYALAGYEDSHDFDGSFYGRLGAQVKFNPNWSVGADVKLLDGGDTQWFVGPRFTW
jgi:Ax21 family sulfation-dependent quorum factor